jgi:hypothetical protein
MKARNGWRAAVLAATLSVAAGCEDPEDDRFPWDAGWDRGSDGGSEAGDVPGILTTMRGVVWSPGHVVPISGALVYFALSDPAPIPDHAYPENCVDPPSPYFTFSEPDGSFAVNAAPGEYQLVVQKGQFRRVRPITVPATGPVDVPEAATTLPARRGDGDTIPNIALSFALDAGDHIEDVLAKLTMGDIDSDNRLVRGTEPFDLYNISPYPSSETLLRDLSRMMTYHIIFFPCTIDGGEQLSDPTAPLLDPAVRDNIRAYLEAGGRIYATDMMYDVFEQPLPEYVDICGDDAVLDDGDHEAWAYSETASGWTSRGRSVDADLSAWLDAIGVGHENLDFLENFVWVEDYLVRLDPRPGESAGPKVWVEGDFVLERGRIVPLTMTWQHGGGKVLFSTYHTVGDGWSPGHDGILPQEYVLIYLIMEIGVCTAPLI